MDKLNTKQQVMILVLAFLLMLLAFFMLAWKPQMAALADLDKKRTEAEKNLDAAKNTIIVLGEVKKNSPVVEAEFIKISGRVPSEPKLPQLIIELQNIANDAGVTLNSLNPGAPTLQGEYSEIQVNVAVQGSYAALIDFLRRLEQAPRALKIGVINIQVAEYPDLSMNFAINAFVMGSGGGESVAPPSQTAAAPAAPAPAQGTVVTN